MFKVINKFISISFILLLFSLSLMLVKSPGRLNKDITLDAPRIPVDESNCTDNCNKVTGDGIFHPGGGILYNLVVTNTSALTMTGGLTLTDFLSGDFAFQSIEQQGWRCDTPPNTVNVDCTYLDVLPPGATTVLTLNLTITAAAGPTVSNHAHFGFTQPDGAVLVYSAEVTNHLGSSIHIPLMRRSGRVTGSGSMLMR